jgi:hypothetical protein
MEPFVNNSIKSFGQISKEKVGPASAARMNVKNCDWGAQEAVANGPSGFQNTKLTKYPDDIQSPLKQMGINPQYMISLPCVEVNELANKRINRGKGTLFNGQLAVAKPTTGMDEINFEPSQRIGRIGMDATQRPFTFGSFQYAC